GLTGLRRDPGQEVREAQIAGRATPPIADFHPSVANGLPYIPSFGDYSLTQLSPDGFEIRKRTTAGHGWLASAHGQRAAGGGYIGGARDRKSTRLNSSHVKISYAVFCLKKKNSMAKR